MVGRTLSHFEVLEKLGEGGMGVVWKARDARLDRPLALEVLPAGKVTGPALSTARPKLSLKLRVWLTGRSARSVMQKSAGGQFSVVS